MSVFDDIQVGQQVVIHNPYNNLLEPKEVKRVTKTQLTIGSKKYRKSDGYELGSRHFGYSIMTVYPGRLITIEEAQQRNLEQELENKRNRLANKIKGVSFREKSYEVLIKVAELLGVEVDE